MPALSSAGAAGIAADYSTVTETPGTGITRQALDMLWTRYAFAATFCAGKDVLELACGSGQGLGVFAQRARRVVGCDYTAGLVQLARREYGTSIPVLRADAQLVPFVARSFDVVVLFEALYYLASPDLFADECRRLLRSGGCAVVCSVNPEWRDFNPSPHSHRYLTASQVGELFAMRGFDVEIAAAFPAQAQSSAASVVSIVKRFAVALGLVPKTMAGKRLLKRIFFGRLVAAPTRVRDGAATYHAPVRFDPAHPDQFKVFYVVARLR